MGKVTISVVNADHSLLEQLRVRASSHKDYDISIQPVDQKKIAADMTLAVISPISLERVIQPFWPQRRIVADE